MDNKINFYIKLQIPSQEANPNQNIGAILGQKGINIVNFCKEFNEKTINIEKGLLISTKINIYIDKTFSIIIGSPVTSILLKKELNLDKGSKKPGIDFISSISMEKIFFISNIKMNIMNSNNIKSISKSIIGTAKSMGIKILD